MKDNQTRKWIRKSLIVLAWLFVWQIAGMLIHNHILFATPLQTIQAFLTNLTEGEFWRAIAFTLLRIVLGFALGFLLGVLLAALSKKVPLLEEILSPLLSLCKTVPVVCFVVLILVWWGSDALSVAISFLMVFTAVYFSTLEGLKAVSKEMLEMANVFRLPTSTKFFYIYLPALQPFLLGSLKTALGFAWKSGVAAEVIGLPSHSIGEQIYLSKISIDTAGIFAWTAVVCVLSFGFEKLVLGLMRAFFHAKPACKEPKGLSEEPKTITLQNISKAYDGQSVLQSFSMQLQPGDTKILDWPSGAGKTTLFRILIGLSKADAGEIKGGAKEQTYAVQFQEDRLCLSENALVNVSTVTGSIPKAKEALENILEEELWNKPCESLSGGEKRRVALARALAAKGSVLLLDEPFAGLDRELAKRCLSEIEKKKGNRTLLIASHIDLTE